MNDVLSIAELTVDLPRLQRRIVEQASLTVGRGEISALVGESGSGKSTVGLAALGYAKAGARLAHGVITLDGVDVLGLTGRPLRRFRRECVSYVPQDPGTALNPAVRLHAQFNRAIGARGASRDQRATKIREALRSVALPDDATFLRRYPQQLSGGQQQRALIAMAIVNRPSVIVWDEPTTGLDVVTKHEILRLIRDLSNRHGIAGLYISHDLSAVAEIADTVNVMQSGEIVEQGAAEAVLQQPSHDYTRSLLSSVPTLGVEAQRPPLEGTPVLNVRGVGAAYGAVTALQRVSFELGAGECLAVVGESGSGKSTLSRTVAGAGPNSTGEISFAGVELPLRLRDRSAQQRQKIQYVFQNPYGSFQPRRTVGSSVRLAATHAGLSNAGALTLDALGSVGLQESHADRFPDELSGGERQRAALARALVSGPRLILCDEITSALDVSIQAQIIELLRDLMGEGISLLFVTHDLAVAKALAHSVVVLRNGRVVESGNAVDVFGFPADPYTRQLLEHSSSIDSALAARHGAATVAVREVGE